jgi:toxin CcdB
MGALVPRLHLGITIDGAACIMLMSQLVALPRREFGASIGDAGHRRDDIITAVDLMVSGF